LEHDHRLLELRTLLYYHVPKFCINKPIFINTHISKFQVNSESLSCFKYFTASNFAVILDLLLYKIISLNPTLKFVT
jgi:hypothetical protein